MCGEVDVYGDLEDSGRVENWTVRQGKESALKSRVRMQVQAQVHYHMHNLGPHKVYYPAQTEGFGAVANNGDMGKPEDISMDGLAASVGMPKPRPLWIC